jgi:hypothetical protein
MASCTVRASVLEPSGTLSEPCTIFQLNMRNQRLQKHLGHYQVPPRTRIAAPERLRAWCAGGGAGWDWVELHDPFPARPGKATVDGCHPSAGALSMLPPAMRTFSVWPTHRLPPAEP